ncbi:MAG: hypothetical protein NZ876_17985, partial [Dehalococcoidia bacterium]|nr:hypothetical protein [Dehalococcoidia bacterium]
AFLCAAAGLAVFLLAFGQDVSPTAEPTERSTVEPIVVLGGEIYLGCQEDKRNGSRVRWRSSWFRSVEVE